MKKNGSELKKTAEKNNKNSRIKILTAARSLLAEKGFEATSVQEIADRAGVNKRLVFYYFENKEELRLSVLEDFFQGVEKLLYNFCVSPADLADPWLSLLRFSDNFTAFVARSQEPIKILIREIMNEGPFLDTLNERFVRPIFEAGEEYLGQLLNRETNESRSIEHLLISFGGANMFYFILGPLLERLWQEDVSSEKHLEARKKEMRRFILRYL